ncbi:MULTISPECIES: hypothetical protein [Streptomyces]|uniref:hypothetical protein n=1 Tax=Streptomyces TaxID=1883 RepID=UPI002248839E|nr:hypothetical protein [Streptomyces sp. JHD 1]MCX2967370.1 hypothetical protein [Streptomyces sp. JHD 1]
MALDDDRPTTTRNGTAPEPGIFGPPPGSDMAHSEAEKKKAARYIEEHLGPDTHKAGALADGDTTAVVGSRTAPSTVSAGSLRGWEVRTGLDGRLEEWHRNCKRLTARLEGELNGLRRTNVLFQGTELDTGATFTGINHQFVSPIADLAPGGPHPPYASPYRPSSAPSPITEL